MKKTFTIIGTALAGLLFSVSLILIILGISAARKNKIVSVFKYAFAVVATDSMEPTIATQSIIIIKRTEFDVADVDDIIVYFSEINNFYIVHRVCGKNPDGSLKTKGDHPDATEDPESITAENYYGIVLKHGNYLRYIYVIIIISLLTIISIEITLKIKKVILRQRKEIRKKYEEQ